MCPELQFFVNQFFLGFRLNIVIQSPYTVSNYNCSLDSFLIGHYNKGIGNMFISSNMVYCAFYYVIH